MSRALKVTNVFYYGLQIFVLVDWIICLAMFSYAVRASKQLLEHQKSNANDGLAAVGRALLRSVASCAFYSFFVSLFYQIVSFILYRAVTLGDGSKAETRCDTLCCLSFLTGVAVIASGGLMNNTNLYGVKDVL